MTCPGSSNQRRAEAAFQSGYLTTEPSFLATSSHDQFYTRGKLRPGQGSSLCPRNRGHGVGYAALLLFLLRGRGLSLLGRTRTPFLRRHGERRAAGKRALPYLTDAPAAPWQRAGRENRKCVIQWAGRICVTTNGSAASAFAPPGRRAEPLFCERRRLGDPRFGAAEGNSGARLGAEGAGASRPERRGKAGGGVRPTVGPRCAEGALGAGTREFPVS